MEAITKAFDAQSDNRTKEGSMLDALEKKLTLRNSEIPSEQLSSKGLKDNADIKSILRSTKGGEQK